MLKNTKSSVPGGEGRAGHRGSSRGFRRLMRYLLASVVALILCIALLTAGLYLFPPAGFITARVNGLLPSLVGVGSSVRSIDFNTLDHVLIEGLMVDGLLKIPAIRLDLSLVQLLRGRLQVQKIQVDQPVLTLRHEAGSWNIPGKPEARAGPEDARMKSEPDPPQIPVLPVQVELKSFEIKDMSITVDGPGGTTADARGINLRASASAGSAEKSLQVEITGKGPEHTIPLNFNMLEPRPLEYHGPVSLHGRLWSENLDQYMLSLAIKDSGGLSTGSDRSLPDAALSVSASLNLLSQSMNVETFELALGKMADIALSAKVTGLFLRPGLSLHIQRIYCEMGEIFGFAGAFLPDVEVSGKISSTGLVVAVPPPEPGQSPEAVEVSGALNLTDAALSLAKQGLSVSGLNIDLKAEKAGYPAPAANQSRATVNAKADSVALPGMSLAGIRCSISAALSPLEKGAMELEVNASAASMDMPRWGRVLAPAGLEVRAKGDVLSGQLRISSAAAHIGNAMRINASGSLESWQNPRITADLDINAQGRELLRLLPDEVVRSWAIQKLDSTVRLTASLEGMPPRGQSPGEGKISASLDADIQGIITEEGSLEDARLRLILEETRITMDEFRGGSARMSFSAHSLAGYRAALEGFQAELEAAVIPGEGGFRGSIALKARKAEYAHQSWGTFRSPITVNARMDGDPAAGKIAFKDISLQLGKAAHINANAVLSSWAEREIEAKWSLWIDAEPMLQLLPGALREKMPVQSWQGKTRIDGRAGARMDTKWTPTGGGEVQIRSEAEGLKLAGTPVSVDKMHVDGNLKFQYSPEIGPGDIRISHKIRWNTLHLPGGLTLDSGEMQAVSRLKDLNMKDVDLELDAAVGRISGNGVEFAPTGGVTINAGLKGDLQAGNVDVRTARLNAAGLGSLDMNYSMKEWGRTAHADVHCALKDISLLPVPVEGARDLKLSGSLEARVSADVGPDSPPILSLGKMTVPPSLKAEAALEAKGLEISLGEERPLVKGGTGKIHAQFRDKDWTVAAKLDADDIGMLKLPYNSAMPMKVNVELHMEDRDLLRINQITASLGQALATASISGRVQGLGPFIEGAAAVSAREAISRISAVLEMKLGLKAEKEVDVESVLRARGESEMQVSLSLRGGRDCSVKGVLAMSDVSLTRGEDISVGAVRARIPIRKTLILNESAVSPESGLEQVQKKPDSAQSAAPPMGQTLLAEKLRSFSRRQDNLVVDRIAVSGLTVTDFRADVAIEEQSIALQRFVFGGLGGTAGGGLFLQTGKDGMELLLRANAAGIDLRKLMPPRSLKEGKDALVNADVSLSLPIKSGLSGEAFDMGSVNLSLNITRIGEDALNSLLLFMDPQEKNPGIVSARKALKLANPSRVSINVSDGLLSIGLELRSIVSTERIINMNPLQRVPIESLGNFPIINEIVRELNAPVRAAALLGANSLTWSPDGKPVLH